MHWTKTTAGRGEKHLSFGNWYDFTRSFTVYQKGLAYLRTILVIYTFYNLTLISLFQIIFGQRTNVYNTSKVNCLSKKERVHDDVIIRTFSALLDFVWGIYRSPVNAPHKGRGVLMFFISVPEQTVEQTIETPVIRDDIALIKTSL